MVSQRSPGGSAPTPDEDDQGAGSSFDPGQLDGLLDQRVEENRAQLLEPWLELMRSSGTLQEEIDQTVRALQIFFRKWVVEIMFVLSQQGTLRFNELKRSLDGISGRTLSKRLTDLGDQGLVHREVFDEMPVRVEYSLTEKGRKVAHLALPMIVYLRVHGPGGQDGAAEDSGGDDGPARQPDQGPEEPA